MRCLLSSKDDNGGILSEEQIADNIIGVLFAAQDTTASAMTWLLKYLHDHPKLLEAVKVLFFIIIIFFPSSFVYVNISNVHVHLYVEFGSYRNMTCRRNRRRSTNRMAAEGGI